jgi:hypothetical protein
MFNALLCQEKVQGQQITLHWVLTISNPKCLSYDMHSLQPFKDNTDRMDIFCRNSRQWATSLRLMGAYPGAIHKWAVNLASALVSGSYPKVQTVTRIPTQEAQWPEQLAGQMKAKEHTESKCSSKDISSILVVILLSRGMSVINRCSFVLFMLIMDYSCIVDIAVMSPRCKWYRLSTWIKDGKPCVSTKHVIRNAARLCYSIDQVLFVSNMSFQESILMVQAIFFIITKILVFGALMEKFRKR